jgi:ABC-type dipeptide/oligopeptide/nickel transport system permease subunit
VLTDRGFSMGAAPRMAIFPGVASLRLVLALNRFGGALRDELDRRRRCKA